MKIGESVILNSLTKSEQIKQFSYSDYTVFLEDFSLSSQKFYFNREIDLNPHNLKAYFKILKNDVFNKS